MAVAALPVSTRSATFGTKPAVVTIDGRDPIAEIAVSSLSSRTVSFDVRAYRWTQSVAGDQLAQSEAPGVLVVPPIFSIAPYDTTIIRVTVRQMPTAPKVEESYKVVMTEITAAQGAQARAISVPLFVRPSAPSGSVSYVLKAASGNTASLIVKNETNAHVFLGKLTVAVDDKTVYAGKSSTYVLAGSTRTIPLTLTAPLTGQRAGLRFETEDGSQQSAEATVSR